MPTLVFVPGSKRLRPIEVVSEFDSYLHDEVDLLYEAGNASKIKRNFAKFYLKIPEMVWELCSSEVIVMERVDGIPINQIELLKKSNIDLVQFLMMVLKYFSPRYLETVFLC